MNKKIQSKPIAKLARVAREIKSPYPCKRYDKSDDKHRNTYGRRKKKENDSRCAKIAMHRQ